MQLAAGFFCADGRLLRQHDRPRVQACFHLHQAHAGFCVTGFDGALDRRGTAPAWQQRGVHVPATMARNCQDGAWQDQAVGHHHDQVRGNLPHHVAHQLTLQRLGLQHRNTQPGRFALHRRSRHATATTRRAVGLGIDRGYFTTAGRSQQGRNSKIRRAGKNNLHGLRATDR